MTQLLLIEDTPSLQMVYESVLRGAGYDVVSAGTAAEGLQHFRKIRPLVVLLDLMLPDRSGQELMCDFLELEPETNVIVVTANGSINSAVEAMRNGAYEFLLKPFNEQRFLHAVENALADGARARGQRPRHTANDALISTFVGSSSVMQEVYDRIRSVSRSMATVFITGESGTGKEICAQAVHSTSHRASGPFVPLNCGAIPSDLLESEVFGHLKGSFTGAIVDKPGAAAVADGGTLFLDEICEMDLNLQTKLLRFLQTSMIQPVGAPKPHKVNVRIICATNRDPLEEVRRGRFREDLYYRLHVVPIHLPPLRKRDGDVVEIAEVSLSQFAREEGRSFHGLSDEVKSLFRNLSWPGNVRQLLNVLRHVVVLNDGPLVTLDMLPIELHHERERLASPFAPGAAVEQAKPHITLDGLMGMTLAEIEQLVIEETISRHGGSVPKAARVLDVSPSTLYRKRESWAKTGKNGA
ncbi:MAG: sigma-54-dependent Fis family transcriptional regulator [Confluentimicrobium sp.]|jgi:DNA-binding NtrC family response regulator|uniref:sigma-54-dependent transcriptional regulator n=1 Tax=Actibacterium sp. TaxID=1872125 RepID=UPI00050E0DDE|nr:sigma-54 dependent transcriptional regulator [Actibacterium sp.]KGB83455.1 ATPase AAA [Rhodovulum sp. NI22]MBC58577.1 sigma-54-dependent Fis family transcriptional regulator [Actibacterium sp.]MDY6858621.1 sigma-54 dependent transcriptional regulator [Pseudomonadota bacterium]|tara:strand:- start:229 stop:1632 length:1404 start_codon:yes stop_codon:yes gene_type:complete